MVEDLCFHLVDLVQNSVAAGARNIRLSIEVANSQETVTIEVSDDGRGMDARTLEKVQDPFFTTKSFKKVGLGIPLLKATAQACNGEFSMASEVGRGTAVRARLQKDHLDCPPLGDLEATLLSLMVSLDKVNVQFSFRSEAGEFAIASDDIRRQIGTLHFSHPDVYQFLKDYVHEGLAGLLGQAG